MVLDPCSNLPVGLALERSDKAQKSQLSTLGDKVNYMSPPEAGDPVGGRHHTSQQTFSISNYKDSVKSSHSVWLSGPGRVSCHSVAEVDRWPGNKDGWVWPLAAS